MKQLGAVITAYRDSHRYGVRGLAKIIGISAATLNRIEHGKNCDARSLNKIWSWLMGAASIPKKKVEAAIFCAGHTRAAPCEPQCHCVLHYDDILTLIEATP